MNSTLHLFDAAGIEIEFALIDASTGDIRPVADLLLRDDQGRPSCSIRAGDVTWSNELVLHVLELKTAGPRARPFDAHDAMVDAVRRAATSLRPHGALLCPIAAHPWMNPRQETVLWPHEDHDIYEAFDRMFDCRRHGWANLQSMHLNLPFADEEEFARLHRALRILMPLLPALTAASPFLDGRFTGLLDSRLEVYRTNSDAIPVITGLIVPEPRHTRADYDALYREIAAAIAPIDPEGILDPVWVNARGAMARFDRGSIEIRTIDTQESVTANLAVAEATIAVTRALCDERWSSLEDGDVIPTEALAELHSAAVRDGERASFDHRDWLKLFGLSGPIEGRSLWSHLLDTIAIDSAAGAHLEHILRHGTLARRMLRFTGSRPDRNLLHALLLELTDCLLADREFIADRHL